MAEQIEYRTANPHPSETDGGRESDAERRLRNIDEALFGPLAMAEVTEAIADEIEAGRPLDNLDVNTLREAADLIRKAYPPKSEIERECDGCFLEPESGPCSQHKPDASRWFCEALKTACELSDIRAERDALVQAKGTPPPETESEWARREAHEALDAIIDAIEGDEALDWARLHNMVTAMVGKEDRS